VTILDDGADAFLSENEAVLVLVHTSWCGHCKSMKPDFIRVSDELAASKSSARLAAIEGDKFRNWLEPFGVTGFPTLLYFEKGKSKRFLAFQKLTISNDKFREAKFCFKNAKK